MRIIIVHVMSKGDVEDDDDYDDETGAEDVVAETGPNSTWDDEDEDLHMDVARVYEKTLVKLGEVLGKGGGIEAMEGIEEVEEY